MRVIVGVVCLTVAAVMGCDGVRSIFNSRLSSVARYSGGVMLGGALCYAAAGLMFMECK